jgi:hypothetical protein
VHNTDPSGEFSLGELNAGIYAQLTVVRQAFVTSGKQAGGAALRTLGKVVEESVEKILVRHLGANAVRSEIKLVGPGGQRVIDSMLTLGNRISYLEVKYGLPRAAGPCVGPTGRADADCNRCGGSCGRRGGVVHMGSAQ